MTQPAAPAFMAKDVLKPLLRLAKRRGVACCVCLTHGHEAVLFLHRRMKPRRCMEEVRHQAKALDLDLPTIRFGRARVDAAADSQTVLLTLNKPEGDKLRRALLAVLRPVGFQHCVLADDAALEQETGEFDEDTLDEMADAEDEEEDLDALHDALGTLVQAIAARHGHDQALVGLATEAQACLKVRDARGASARIQRLRSALS